MDICSQLKIENNQLKNKIDKVINDMVHYSPTGFNEAKEHFNEMVKLSNN